jgi:hypothetical protein
LFIALLAAKKPRAEGDFVKAPDLSGFFQLLQENEHMSAISPSSATAASPAPSIAITSSLKEHSVEQLLALGQSSHNQEKVNSFLIEKVRELFLRAQQDLSQLPSVRTDLCLLSRISAVHYYDRKMDIFNLLQRLLENDPVLLKTATDVLKDAIELNADLEQCCIVNAATHTTPIQQKLVRSFVAAVELYIRHQKKKSHVGVILEAQKEVFFRVRDQFAKLDNKDTALRFANKMALEAIKRVTSNRETMDEILGRLTHIGDAIQAIYNEHDISKFFQLLAAAVTGLSKEFNKEWFDSYCLLQEMCRNTRDDRQKIVVIEQVLDLKKKWNWKFLYGVLESIENIVHTEGQSLEVINNAMRLVKNLGKNPNDERNRLSIKALELQKAFSELLKKLDDDRKNQKEPEPKKLLVTVLPSPPNSSSEPKPAIPGTIGSITHYQTGNDFMSAASSTSVFPSILSSSNQTSTVVATTGSPPSSLPASTPSSSGDLSQMKMMEMQLQVMQMQLKLAEAEKAKIASLTEAEKAKSLPVEGAAVSMSFNVTQSNAGAGKQFNQVGTNTGTFN